jgi:hypothetical protein
MFQQIEADFNGLKPRVIEFPVSKNYTEAEWHEILDQLVPKPEEVYESRNDSKPQPGNDCHCI